jgi:SAM-dependent methyltransferase
MAQSKRADGYLAGIKRRLKGGRVERADEPADDEAWRHMRLYHAEASIPMPSLALQGQVGPAPAFHDIALNTMGRMNMAGLRPDHDVLDIGCGVGRTARYLCDFLDSTSTYEGFDIMEEMIQWCQKEITPRFPNFHFTYTPLFNAAYLPDATLATAETFTFPYEDGSFDFAFAHSVFTHLLPDATLHYLQEIHRVLRPGGIIYATWFLFDGQLITSPHPMVTDMQLDSSGTFAVRNHEVPDEAVAYQEAFMRDAYSSHGLVIDGPIHPGFRRLQDAVVAVRQQ